MFASVAAPRRAGFPGVLASFLLCLPAAVQGQQAAVEGLEASPALSALDARLAAADSGAEAEFWQTVRESGTPLVDPDDAHAGYSIVTFVGRGGPDVDRMRIHSNFTALLVDRTFLPPDSLGWMKRLDGTNVWYRSFRFRDDLRVPYRLATYRGNDEPSVDVDPLNPLVWEPGVDGLKASILELADAPPQPWRNPSGEEGDGDWDELTDDESGRSVYVYKPVQWAPDRAEPYPLLIGLGAFGHGIGMRVDRMVDELVGTERLPPMIVALVDLTSDDETTNYRTTADFVLDELLPYLREQYGATTDPRHIVVSGTSRRGMVASLLALEYPDTFGNVLSLSGSYYWRPADVEAFEWVPMRYAFEERRPVRFYVAAGELETFVSPGNRGHYLLATNRHMRDVLVARGYDLEYVEFNGVHSDLNWQDWLAEGLVHLLGANPVSRPD